jgi:hypothetical protein
MSQANYEYIFHIFYSSGWLQIVILSSIYAS